MSPACMTITVDHNIIQPACCVHDLGVLLDMEMSFMCQHFLYVTQAFSQISLPD